MDRRGLHEDFCATAPHHDHPVQLVLGLEPPDVGDQLVRQFPLVGPRLEVRTHQPLHVPLVEDGRPGADRFQFRAKRLDQARLEHAGRAGRLVAIVGEDVPAAKHQVVE